MLLNIYPFALKLPKILMYNENICFSFLVFLDRCFHSFAKFPTGTSKFYKFLFHKSTNRETSV